MCYSACIVWGPHTKFNIKKLEIMQLIAARFVYVDYRSLISPSVLIKRLGSEKLAEGRARSKAILKYKIQNNVIPIP